MRRPFEGDGAGVRSAVGAAIQSVRIIGGFLAGAELSLHEGLNCVIGARGTGKTTALELIRFALNTPGVAGNGKRLESLVEDNLKGGRVEVTVRSKDGLEYVVSRTSGEEPIVLTPQGKTTEISIGVSSLFRVDIYSQNEVESIADEPSSQLRLLDSFEQERIGSLNSSLLSITNEIAANAAVVHPLQTKIAALDEELAALPSLNESLQAMSAVGGAGADAINEAHAAKALRDREHRAVQAIGEFIGDYRRRLQERPGEFADKIRSLLSRDVGTGANGELIDNMKRQLLACGEDVGRLLGEATQRTDAAIEELLSAAQTLTAAHHEQELAFRRLIEQHQAAQGQSAERTRLEKVRNELQAKQHARRSLSEQLEGLEAERAKLLQQLSVLRDQRFSLRRNVADRITASLRNVLRVSISQHGDTTVYQDMLTAALKLAKLRTSVVVPKLAASLWPQRLASLVRVGDCSTIAMEAGISEDQARKVIDALATAPLTYQLETVELEDSPRIELNDKGQYKDSQSLSTGQKCTTILPILLLENERPLLIDQPEDNLDNRFVFECIVDSIRRVKKRRQLLFVTHNPNIPVLGDAERVFVFDSDGRSARIAIFGSVDECKEEIVTLLEGGEEAFRQRLTRYAYA